MFYFISTPIQNVLIVTNNKYSQYQPRVSHSTKGSRIVFDGEEQQKRKKTAEGEEKQEKSQFKQRENP